MGIVRIGKMFNRRDQKKGLDQKGIFDIRRAKGYRDFILTDPANPFISGTDVPRLRPMHLGANPLASAKMKFSASSWRCRIFTPAKPLSVSVPTRRPRHTATSGRSTSARSPMSECLAPTPTAKPVSRARGDAGGLSARIIERSAKTTAGVPQPSQKDWDKPAGYKGNSLMLNTIPTTLLAPRQLRGLFLSKNKLPPKARLAAEILEQRAVVTKLTVGQIASVCQVSVSSVNAARGGRGRKPADLTLARIWGRATPQQRLEFIRCAGPDAVWTALAAAL